MGRLAFSRVKSPAFRCLTLRNVYLSPERMLFVMASILESIVATKTLHSDNYVFLYSIRPVYYPLICVTFVNAGVIYVYVLLQILSYSKEPFSLYNSKIGYLWNRYLPPLYGILYVLLFIDVVARMRQNPFFRAPKRASIRSYERRKIHPTYYVHFHLIGGRDFSPYRINKPCDASQRKICRYHFESDAMSAPWNFFYL